MRDAFVTDEIHPIFLELGVNLQSGKIMGSNARCLAILSAFKIMIRDY